MILSLLSVLAALGCLVPQSTGQLPPAAGSLVYVFATFRHGPRSPLYRYYPNHYHTDQHYRIFDGLRGVLTSVGKLKMYEIGKNLKDRYEKFLGEYREDRVWVTSRGASRNVMTSLTILAGMMPPKTRIMGDIPWQPIPAFATTDDKSHMFHDLEFKKLDDCPNFKPIAQKFDDEVIRKVERDKPFYRLLRIVTGSENIDSLFTAHQVYDTLHSEYLNGLKLPLWATELQPGFGDVPLYPTMLRDYIEVWKKPDLATSLLNLFIGPYFYTLKHKLRSKATDDKFDELMHLHVTEDMTLIALLNLLQIKEPNAYEPGNGFILELHKELDNYIVKFFIYDSRTTHNMYEVLPGFLRITQTQCTLTQLLGVVLSPTWEEACGLKQ